MFHPPLDQLQRRCLAPNAVRAALFAGLGTLLFGCTLSPAPTAAQTAEPSSILVEPASLTLEAGHDARLAAQANDTSGQPIGGANFSYTSSDPRVLQVSATGLVTALGPASSTISVIVASGRREQRVPVVVLPGAPRRLEKIGGDDQQLQSGDAPADPLAARIVDQWNNPLANVHLTVESASDLFASSDVVSGPDGGIRFQVPPLTRAGAFVVRLRSPIRAELTVSFNLRVTHGPPASIDRLSSASVPDSSAGASAPIVLRVTDAHGNPIPDIALTARTSAAAAPLLARTDAAGKATLIVAHGPRVRRVNLDVQVDDPPALHRAFTVSFDPPAAPPKARRDG